MRLKPIEGDGWYLEEQRVPPPLPFSVNVIDGEGAVAFCGLVEDAASEFDGYELSASQTFVGQSKWLTVQLSDNNRAFKRVLTGYALVEDEILL